MLELIASEKELFDDKKMEFVKVKETKLQLEHSLISLRKWESKWHKPFLSSKDKTYQELISYIECMNLVKGTDPMVFKYLSMEELGLIGAYIEDPMTATWFNDQVVGAAKSSREIITAEIIYYWMIALNIPIEFEKWHLNQLMTLIKVVNIKNGPARKKSSQEAAIERARLNEERLKKFGSRG